MRNKDFLYWGLNELGQPLVGNLATGQVLAGSKDTLLGPDGKPAWFKTSPEGWKETLVKYGRNLPPFIGIFRTFTVPMKFERDAALIMRHLHWSKGGRNAYCKLLIHKNDRSTWPEWHKTWYMGELDFSKFKQGKDKGEVTMNVMEGGLSKEINAKKNTPYQIKVDDDPEHINIKLDGITLSGKYNFVMQTGNTSGDRLCGMFFYNKEASAAGLVYKDVVLRQTVPSDFTTSGEWFFYTTKDITGMAIKGKLMLTNLFGTSVNFRLRSSAGQNIDLGTITAEDTPLDINITFNSTTEEKWFLVTDVPTIDIYNLADTTISIEFTGRKETTYIKALYPYRLLYNLIGLMTDGDYTIASDWLEAVKDFAYTSAANVRGLADGVITTTLTDLLKDLNRYAIGSGIEADKLRVELVPNFFKNESTPTPAPLILGQVDDCEFENAEDLVFNTIKVGWKKKELEDVNGKFMFNLEQVYSTPEKRIVKELDLVSPYVGDPIYQELYRINYEGRDTTDSKDDKDVFVYSIGTDLFPGDGTIPQHYELYRPAYTSITGIPAYMTSSIYNTEITPKHILLNHGPWIRSVMHQMDEYSLTFQDSDQNSDLSTTLAGVTVSQRADVEIGTLGDRLFLPYYCRLKTSVPFNLQEYMETKPYETIQYNWKKKEYHFFFWDGGIEPATNDRQDWKGLLAPNVNVENLISNV